MTPEEIQAIKRLMEMRPKADAIAAPEQGERWRTLDGKIRTIKAFRRHWCRHEQDEIWYLTQRNVLMCAMGRTARAWMRKSEYLGVAP